MLVVHRLAKCGGILVENVYCWNLIWSFPSLDNVICFSRVATFLMDDGRGKHIRQNDHLKAPSSRAFPSKVD